MRMVEPSVAPPDARVCLPTIVVCVSFTSNMYPPHDELSDKKFEDVSSLIMKLTVSISSSSTSMLDPFVGCRKVTLIVFDKNFTSSE